MKCKCGNETKKVGQVKLPEDKYGNQQRMRIYTCGGCETVSYDLITNYTEPEQKWSRGREGQFNITKNKLEHILKSSQRSDLPLSALLGI